MDIKLPDDLMKEINKTLKTPTFEDVKINKISKPKIGKTKYLLVFGVLIVFFGILYYVKKKKIEPPKPKLNKKKTKKVNLKKKTFVKFKEEKMSEEMKKLSSKLDKSVKISNEKKNQLKEQELNANKIIRKATKVKEKVLDSIRV